MRNMTGDISVAGTAFPSRAPEVTQIPVEFLLLNLKLSVYYLCILLFVSLFFLPPWNSFRMGMPCVGSLPIQCLKKSMLLLFERSVGGLSQCKIIFLFPETVQKFYVLNPSSPLCRPSSAEYTWNICPYKTFWVLMNNMYINSVIANETGCGTHLVV